MVQKIPVETGKPRKKVIPWKVLLFFRKISVGMNHSIYFPTGTTIFSIQMVSAPGLSLKPVSIALIREGGNFEKTFVLPALFLLTKYIHRFVMA